MNEVQHDHKKYLYLIALGAIAVALGLMTFAVGEVLNFVAVGHFTGTHVADGFAFAPRLLFSPGRPAVVWPSESRPSMQPVLFWVFFSALLGIVVTTVVHLIRRTGAIERLRDDRSATWAKMGDLRRLVVSDATPRRLTLGFANGKLLAAEETRSLLVLGPPGSHKTSAFAINAILEWEGPVVATSVKSDLMAETIAHRRSKGKVRVYDPAQVIQLHERHHWTPLARCGTFDGAQDAAASLVSAAKLSAGGGSDGDFWFSQAGDLLAPYLYAAHLAGADISTVVQWVDRQEEKEVTKALLEDPDDMPLSTAEGIWSLGPDQRSSVFTTARTVVSAYRNAKVLDTARRSEISPLELLDGGANTVYLSSPSHEQEKLQPLYATLIQEIVDAVYEHETRTGKPLDPPLLLLLDECANIAPIDKLDQIASTARGVGMQLVSVFQDFAQVRARWGHDKAQTILSCHLAKLILPGISDEYTLEWVSRVTGDQEVRQLSHTSGKDSKSTNESTTFRSLAPANVVRELKKLTALLIYDNMAPAKIDLRPWFADRALRGLVDRAKANDPLRLNPATGEVLVPPDESGVRPPELIGPLPKRPAVAIEDPDSDPETPVEKVLELPWRSV